MLSEADAKLAMKSQVLLSGINNSNCSKRIDDDVGYGRPIFQTADESVKERSIWCIQALNQAYFVKILKRSCEALCRESPETWSKEWILHHENAPAHKAPSSSSWNKIRQLKPISLIWAQKTSGSF
jgi:hypothetical protein